jgi:hypothetical protein
MAFDCLLQNYSPGCLIEFYSFQLSDRSCTESDHKLPHLPQLQASLLSQESISLDEGTPKIKKPFSPQCCDYPSMDTLISLWLSDSTTGGATEPSVAQDLHVSIHYCSPACTYTSLKIPFRGDRFDLVG